MSSDLQKKWGVKSRKASSSWSIMVPDNHSETTVRAKTDTAGIARDDNTRFSKAGKPDFSNAQSVSDHLMQSQPEQWQETFQTNLTAQFFVTAAFLPLLAKGRDLVPGFSSSVCNVASISGVMKGSSSGQFAYATSKAGMYCITVPFQRHQGLLAWLFRSSANADVPQGSFI